MRGGLMDNGLEPKFLICTECNEEFVFTIQAQEYFAERGYSEDPKRCKSCHTCTKKDNGVENLRNKLYCSTQINKKPRTYRSGFSVTRSARRIILTSSSFLSQSGH